MKHGETFIKQEGAVSTAHSMGVVIDMKIEPPKDEENGDLITTMSANIMVILKFLKWGHERTRYCLNHRYCLILFQAWCL